MVFLKKFLLVLAVTSQMGFAADVADKKTIASVAVNFSDANFAEKELTNRQKVALSAIKNIHVLACAAMFATGFVSRLPDETPRMVKVAAFVPVAFIFVVGGYSSWEECNLDGFFKKHKWLLLGL